MPPSRIDGDDDAGDDPISFLVVRENAVIGAAIIYYAAAATLAHRLSSARADDLRRHVLRNRPRSVKGWLTCDPLQGGLPISERLNRKTILWS